MDWITTSGQTIDEAKSNALDQLGIVADEAEFDIVNDVEKGRFLGRVKNEAKVRARVKPKAPAARGDRPRRGGQKRGGPGRNGGGRTKRATKQGGDQGRGQRSASKESSAQKPRARQNRAPQERASHENASRGRQKSADSGQKRKDQGNRDTGTDSRQSQPQNKKEDAVEHEFSRQEQEAVAIDFLGGMLSVFDMKGSAALVTEPAEDEAIEIAVTGSELGLLVGPKGSTLNAVQELTRTVVQRNSGGARTERLRVDVGGYRERRSAALQEFASKIAADVVESGSEKVLEPMGPADRKVVHDTVTDIAGVETGSEGEEPRRRVVIRPT